MAPTMKTGWKSRALSAVNHQGRREYRGSQAVVEYRPRNESAVRMFGLRSSMRVYVGHQQAPTPRRSRRGAGRRAWATRIAKYGPSGRKPQQQQRMPQQAHVPQPSRMQPQVVITTTSQPGDQPLAFDEAPGLGTGQREERGILIAPLSDEVDSPVPNEADAPPMNDEIDDAPVVNDFEDSIPAPPPPPPPIPRPALAEVTLPPPTPFTLSPTRPPPPTNTPTDVEETTRLLNERRARLLGPQNITQTPREPRPVGFIVFNDPPTNGSELDIGIEDKENEEPEWNGRSAPPAPGPSRLEGSVLGERPADSMGSQQGASGSGRWFGGFFGRS